MDYETQLRDRLLDSAERAERRRARVNAAVAFVVLLTLTAFAVVMYFVALRRL